MNSTFHINTAGIVELANTLEKLHRSAFPVAVRQTLNDAAVFAKTRHLKPAYQQQFTIRKPSFIPAHTGFRKCVNTFVINKMVSEFGIIQGKSKAGDQLVSQEMGGRVRRPAIPLPGARVGRSANKLVNKRYYLDKIKPKTNVPKHEDQAFIRAAFKAGIGGFVNYDDIIYEINKLEKPSREHLFIKSEAIYTLDDDRIVEIKQAPFISVAGRNSSKGIHSYFSRNAQNQIKKYAK